MKYKLCFLAMIIGLVFGYLFGVFVAASFDISSWSDIFRFMTALVMIFFGFVFSFMVFVNEELK